MAKIVVGLSGGVDSSVACYLLKKQGHEVIGVFMRNWDSFANNEFLGFESEDFCEQEKDYQDAKKVAQKLKIPFFKIDFVNEYWKFVFSDFLEKIKTGITPNPDILCNRKIKFGIFLQTVLEKFSADYVATGHYAKIKNNCLFKPKDKDKDQTYFLAQVAKKKFEKIIFPLSNLTKSEVRNIATLINLPNAKKKDSTGICFVGKKKFSLFLENYIEPKTGFILDFETKKILGKHKGIYFYTLGQRKGLNLGGQIESHFVVSKNLAKNELYVAPISKEHLLMSDNLECEKINWICLPKDLENLKIMAKFRYRQAEIPVKIELKTKNLARVFYQPFKAITPGQQIVFYWENKCLGGGFIKSVYWKKEKIF